MVDGPAVADIDPIPSALPFGISFRVEGSDTTRSEHPHQPTREMMHVRLRWIGVDASVGSTFDLLDAREPELACHEVVNDSEHLSQAVASTHDQIEATLREDREEACLQGEVCATEAATATCKRIAFHIAPWLALSSESKWAAFGEDTGGVSLVLRSVVSNRRVDFRISPDGLIISAVHIDENLEAKVVPLTLEDRRSLRESAAWVHRRP